MSVLPRVLKRAVSLWWRNAVHVTFINVLWLALQFPIVTGPPATAALYAVMQRLSHGELITLRDVWLEVRKMFIPAWKWGAANIVAAFAIGGNFWLSRSQPGDLWIVLRFVWVAAAVLWIAINVFYWPLWLAQTDRSLGNTLRNGLVLLLRAPDKVLLVTFFSVVLVALSVVTLIPLINWLMVWLASIGLFATEEFVQQVQDNS
jgi:uncharacterized membrane protein YesL